MIALPALLAVAFALPPGTARSPGIVLDGRFDDWDGVPVVVTDPADEQSDVDFGTVRAAHDDRSLHLLIETGKVVNVQKLNGRIEVLVNVDDNERTGGIIRGMRGVDFIVELTPANIQDPQQPGEGVGVSVPLDQPPPGDRMHFSGYAVGLAFAPTYADDLFELRLDRTPVPGAAPWPVEGPVSIRLDFLDARGELRDQTDAFTYELTPGAPTRVDQPTDPLARPAGTTLRVVSWNAEFGRLFEKPTRFAAVLHALAPDVILFQELTEEHPPRELREWLDDHLPALGGRWNAVVGSGGGNLRCAVASHFDLIPATGLDRLDYPDRPDRSVRLAAAFVEVPAATEARVLAVSVHLRCCGSAGSFEDRTRSIEAEAIRRALSDLAGGVGYDALILGGDLNLVGARHPLDVLVEGVAPGGGNLAIAEPYQLNARSNATWADQRLPFAPGRLDYILLGGLSVTGSLVLDTRDLFGRWGQEHGLTAGDTVEASDHLPVVVDLRMP